MTKRYQTRVINKQESESEVPNTGRKELELVLVKY